MAITQTCCEFCDCYIVQCDKCGERSNKCGNYDRVQAAERARIAGYRTSYAYVGAPAQWLCPSCAANKDAQTKVER